MKNFKVKGMTYRLDHGHRVDVKFIEEIVSGQYGNDALYRFIYNHEKDGVKVDIDSTIYTEIQSK